jgi:hypothetical protein
VYRKISNFRPTENENLLDAYEIQMENCTLLCEQHHKHTHTHYLLEKNRMEQCAAFLLSLSLLPPTTTPKAVAAAMWQLKKLT